MKKKIVIIVAIVLLGIAISFILGLRSLRPEKNENIGMQTVDNKDILNNKVDSDSRNQTQYASVRTPAPQKVYTTPVPDIQSPSEKPTPTPINKYERFASITLITMKKTKTFEIMHDVNEYTLKRNIGWLPSSVLPGQEGLCILMGHRDTDFSILKYAEVGDSFVVTMNDIEYHYVVSNIMIVNSDSELRFNALNGENLLLVTCYPFRYSGHAPQKILFYATKIN